MKNRSPWAWIPTLYFAEGLPNVIVMTVAVTMYMQLGLSDTEIGLYTGWLALPWVVKPLWSPFIDVIRTKRWWVLAMQILLGASLAGVAFTLNAPWWFQGTLFCFFLMAFASATHDVAADGFYMIQLDQHDQAWFVGIRNTFYRLAVIFGTSGIIGLAGVLQVVFRNRIAYTWSLIFYGLAGIFIALFLYHGIKMPSEEHRPQSDALEDNTDTEVSNSSLFTLLSSFFTKVPWRQMVVVVLFLLLYRFPEAMLSKLSTTFLQRPLSDGGLGLSPQEFGLAYGTVGLIGLLLGGIVGGWLASRDGLKHWLWVFVCALTLPDLVYVWMSFSLTQNLTLISLCLFVEQFGYGLGFTALTLYMLYFSQGRFQTSHYSICTGISYLGLMLPGIVSGWVKDMMGYQQFFLLVMVFCIVPFIVAAFIKIDPQFGKKAEV